MIYYFRQPDNKIEYYEFYKNTSLTRVGEVLLDTSDDYKLMVWAVKYYNNVK